MNTEKIAERVARGMCEKVAKYPDTPPTEEEKKKWREQAEERRRKEGIRPRKGSSAYDVEVKLAEIDNALAKMRYEVLHMELLPYEKKEIMFKCVSVIGQAKELLRNCEK